jgi:HlyD family secretion protein
MPATPGPEPSHSPRRLKRAGSRRIYFIAGALLLAGAVVGTTLMLMGSSNAHRPDLLLHTVRYENLDLTVVERGTLESAENKDVICRVKSGAKGSSFATTIKWVVDDGTLVRAGQPIVILDSSGLEDQYLTQKIAVDKARADAVAAEAQYRITESQNELEIGQKEIAVQLAEISLEKYVGLPKGTLNTVSQEEARKLIAEMNDNLEEFLAKYRRRFGAAKGEFQGSLEDLSGQVELKRADVEQWEDRVNYSQRMGAKGYVSPSQVQSDESKLNGAVEVFKKAETDLKLLRTFTAVYQIKDLSSKVHDAWRVLEVAKRQARAKEITAASDRDTKTSVFHQEEDKLDEIEKQIHECKIFAPQDGMVVYYIPEQSRFGSGSQQSIIAQGEPVREGQKLMRIPDLRRMQVSTRVHEAMVSRVRGDDRRSTGFADSLRSAMLLNTDAFGRLFGQHEVMQDSIRDHFRDKEYYLASPGQKATVVVDAFYTRPLDGHVKTVATVASQQDWMTADVKVYQTTVGIDDSLEGLKPGMSAEVTIHIESTGEKVLALPIQAIVGGAESGKIRKCYVQTEAGPQERKIKVGLSNDKMAEIREGAIEDGEFIGLKEGEQVIINPKVLLGDKIKTREPGELKETTGRGGPGKGGPGKGGAGGKGNIPNGGPGMMKGGFPPGGPDAKGGPDGGGR